MAKSESNKKGEKMHFVLISTHFVEDIGHVLLVRRLANIA